MVHSHATITTAARYGPPDAAGRRLTTTRLRAGEEAEALAFLSTRPLHTVALSGLLRDNGVESPRNRGTFYGCRSSSGRLEGVALVGHATLFEARGEGVVEEFSRLAGVCPTVRLVLGETGEIWQVREHFESNGLRPRLSNGERLLVLNWPVAVREAVEGLRRAEPRDLELITPVQAEMSREESGVNPLEIDPKGFRQRILRRIEAGRIHVWVEGGRLIFKADVIAETPEASYLEGIYVNPDFRRRGAGLRCLSQLSRHLLRRTRALTLLVNELNAGAFHFYHKAGFRPCGSYATLYLQH